MINFEVFIMYIEYSIFSTTFKMNRIVKISVVYQVWYNTHHMFFSTLEIFKRYLFLIFSFLIKKRVDDKNK